MDAQKYLPIKRHTTLLTRLPETRFASQLAKAKANWIVFGEYLSPQYFDDIDFFTGTYKTRTFCTFPVFWPNFRNVESGSVTHPRHSFRPCHLPTRNVTQKRVSLDFNTGISQFLCNAFSVLSVGV